METGHYKVTADKEPVWVLPGGEVEKYVHQDGNYSNLCGFSYCKCKD